MLDWLDVHELQDVVAGSLPGRAGDGDITLFKSNGLAAWDLAAAARVVELASRSRLGDVRLRVGDQVVAERVHHVGPVEQTPDLLGRAAVRDVVVVEDLRQRASTVVLADHVLGDPLLALRARREERERAPDRIEDSHDRTDCIVGSGEGPGSRRALRRTGRGWSRRRRQLRTGRDLDRASAGAVWSVGRAVNPQHRESDEPRVDDYVWEGYELEDCLEAANAALEDDAVVSEEDGAGAKVRPFRREELLEPLEKFFFGR